MPISQPTIIHTTVHYRASLLGISFPLLRKALVCFCVLSHPYDTATQENGAYITNSSPIPRIFFVSIHIIYTLQLVKWKPSFCLKFAQVQLHAVSLSCYMYMTCVYASRLITFIRTRLHHPQQNAPTMTKKIFILQPFIFGYDDTHKATESVLHNTSNSHRIVVLGYKELYSCSKICLCIMYTQPSITCIFVHVQYVHQV